MKAKYQPTPAEVRAWRAARKLSQERAGEVAGVSREQWWNYEHGRRKMPAFKWSTLNEKRTMKKAVPQ